MTSAGPVAVHPRMRLRRMEVRRDAGRRRLRRVVAVLSVLTVAGVAWAAIRSPLLDVDRVRVRGGEHTPSDTVAAAAGVSAGDTMAAVDPAAVARRVEALPWVAEARVHRDWPGTVRIEVVERLPLAVAPLADGRRAVLDRAGRVLTVTRGTPSGLAELAGVAGRLSPGDTIGPGARRALAVLGAVAERLPGVVTGVTTDLDATLATGGVVRFGSADDLDAKVLALEAVLTDVDTACLATLDVRAPATPALTRHEGCP